MIALVLALRIAVPWQDAQSEPFHAFFAPGEWAELLAKFDGKPVARRDIRRAVCVGIEPNAALCGWEQRRGGRWHRYSQYADLSRPDGVRLLPGERVKERLRQTP